MAEKSQNFPQQLISQCASFTLVAKNTNEDGLDTSCSTGGLSR